MKERFWFKVVTHNDNKCAIIRAYNEEQAYKYACAWLNENYKGLEVDAELYWLNPETLVLEHTQSITKTNKELLYDL